MTLTHAQLMDAVRAAGRDRESFTCADVRQQLGLSTADRVQMNRFYKRFSALQKSATDEIEKLGNNCYRLRASEAPVVEAETMAAPIVEAAVVEAAVVAAPVVEAAVVEAAVVAAPVVEAAVVEAAVVEAAVVEAPLVAALITEIPEAEPTVTVEPAQRPALAPVVLAQAAGAAEAGVDAQPVLPGKKRRAPWLSRMASFFGRRSKSDDVRVAVGA